LKKLKLSKEKLESIAIQVPINKEELKTEFIKIAKVISPNTSSRESIELLQSVLSNQMELNSYQSAEEDEINIMTLHKSKGLEFDVVIHLDLYEWILPKKKPGANNDFNNPIYDNWTQDVNLHYVGITRAKNGCILVSSKKRTNYEYKQKQGKDSEFIWNNNIKELRHK
jgi:DNA helicase-2/ATP-dependent DNA helicase PcrA